MKYMRCECGEHRIHFKDGEFKCFTCGKARWIDKEFTDTMTVWAESAHFVENIVFSVEEK